MVQAATLLIMHAYAADVPKLVGEDWDGQAAVLSIEDIQGKASCFTCAIGSDTQLLLFRLC